MILQVLDPASYALSPYAVPTIVTATILSLLGLMVLLRERGSVVSRVFHVMTLAVSIWFFCFSWMYCATDERVAQWWAKAAYLGVPFICAAIYHFTVTVLGLYPRQRTIVWAGWIISAVLSAVSMSTDALISGVYRYWWGYYPRYGWFSAALLPFFFTMMLASLRHYWREYRKAMGGPREVRIKWFMLAYVGALVASVDYLPKFGVPVYPFGWLAVLCWLVFAERAIWRYRLVEITPAFAADKIISTMKNAILVFDHEGIVRVANRAACDLLRRGEAELVGQPIWSINPDFFPRRQVSTLIQSGMPLDCEITCVFEPDRIVTLEISASAITDRAGHPMAVVCIARDVTAHRQAVDALMLSEERFRSIAQSANDAIVSADSEGKIVYWNKGAERIFGYQPEEVRGHPLTVLMPERYRKAHREGLSPLPATEVGRVVGRTVELQGLRKDGTEFPVEISVATWRAGNESFYNGIIRDISERKRAEKALRESEERLRQAQKMEAIGRLAGGVAHDFNNLLTVITGYSHIVLAQLGRTHPLLGKIEEIRKAGDRAAGLTRQLLAFSRKQIMEPKVIDLNVLTENLAGMLRRLIGEHIELVTRLEPALWPIKADPGQIEQAVMNLVVNARDAMPQGGRVMIETANVELNESYTREHVDVLAGSYVRLTVDDTGCGMDAETQARIFEPFFSTKGPGKGTGLGLSTVYGIVDQSGGHITFSSEVGKGARFMIYLPRVYEMVGKTQKEHLRTHSSRGTETVLLVEDDAMVRALVRDTLRSLGYMVMEAGDGNEALAICKEHDGTIHLLVADVIMPGMNGKELAARLGQLRPGLKVLYISGYAHDAIVHHGVLDEGAVLLQKPFMADALARKTREVLDNG